MPFNIVLVEPEIHTNTGNIRRLSLSSGSNLHLVKPFGFEIDDTRLKRAGLDYWKHISLFIYENLAEFYTKNKGKNMIYFSSHGEKTHWEANYEEDQFLIFGKESSGLAQEIIDNNIQKTYKIPIYNNHVRSLNLANAVSIVVYEGIKNTSH